MAKKFSIKKKISLISTASIGLVASVSIPTATSCSQSNFFTTIPVDFIKQISLSGTQDLLLNEFLDNFEILDLQQKLDLLTFNPTRPINGLNLQWSEVIEEINASNFEFTIDGDRLTNTRDVEFEFILKDGFKWAIGGNSIKLSIPSFAGSDYLLDKFILGGNPYLRDGYWHRTEQSGMSAVERSYRSFNNVGPWGFGYGAPLFYSFEMTDSDNWPLAFSNPFGLPTYDWDRLKVGFIDDQGQNYISLTDLVGQQYFELKQYDPSDTLIHFFIDWDAYIGDNPDGWDILPDLTNYVNGHMVIEITNLKTLTYNNRPNLSLNEYMYSINFEKTIHQIYIENGW